MDDTDDAALTSLLGRVGALGLSSRQDVHCETPEDALGFIADCIQISIMPRQMLFTVNETENLSAFASGGRLLRIDTWPSYPSFVGKTLKSEDAAALCDALIKTFHEAERIAMVPTPGMSGDGAALHGIPGAQILAMAGLASLSSVEGNMLDALIDGAQDVLFACVPEGAAPILFAEGVTLPPGLVDWIAIAFKRMDADQGAIEDGTLALFQPQDFADLAIGIHVAEGQKTALVTEPGAIPDISNYWASLPSMVVGVEGAL